MGGFSRSIQSRRQIFRNNNLSKAQVAKNRMLEMERRRKAIREAEESEANARMNKNYSVIQSDYDE